MTRKNTILQEGEELERAYSVDAMEGSCPFYTINPETQKKELLGRLGFINYDNDQKLRVMAFRPTPRLGFEVQPDEDESPRQQEAFSLGVVKGQYTLLDHATILKPLMDLGFEVTKMNFMRGGTRAMATLQYPGIALDDPIAWDLEQFEKVPAKRKIFFSLGVWMDARSMHGIHFAAGYFRLLCTNGLMSTVLGMGSLNLTHRHWNVQRVSEFGEGVLEQAGKGKTLGLPTMGTKALSWGQNAIANLVARPEEFESLPGIAKEPLRQLRRIIPDKALTSLADQLGEIRGEKEFSGLDILNAITNAGRQSNGNGLALRQERITSAVMNLVELGAFRSNVKYTLGSWGQDAAPTNPN